MCNVRFQNCFKWWNCTKRFNVMRKCSSNHWPFYSIPDSYGSFMHIWDPNVPERNTCSTMFYVTSSTGLNDRETSKQTLSRPYSRSTRLSQIWFVLTWLSACCQNPMWGLILTCTWDVLLKALRLCPRLQYSSVKRPRFMHHKRLAMYHESITFEVSARVRGFLLTCAKNLARWFVFTASLT